MASSRVIFHIDMNCFFASCEIAEDLGLKGKAMAVASTVSDRKSIILSASYEARAYGIHSAMPIFEAKRLCPNLIIVEPNMDRYSEYSRKFFEYFLKITPLVEPASIDEGFLDVTDVCKGDEYISLAKRIQDTLYNDFKLPCSIGIAPNKFLAKMGSDIKKPMGITIMRKREIKEVLWPLPIRSMFGVGKKTAEILSAMGIKTIGDLANYPDKSYLKSMLGEQSATALLSHAFGEGSNVIDVNRFTSVDSISNSQTFDRDEYSYQNVLLNIKILSNCVSNRLENSSKKAYSFTLQLKYSNFNIKSKSLTLSQPINSSYQMSQVFQSLLDEIYDTDFPVRLVGVAAAKLVDSVDDLKQLSIFDSLDKEDKDLQVSNVIKNINAFIGGNALKKGVNAINEDKMIRFDKTYKYNQKNLNK